MTHPLLRKTVWSVRALPARLLPRDLREPDSYIARGFGCTICGWTTPRSGFSGRQAVRGHLRRHRIEQRAWSRPLYRQLALSLVILGAAAIGLTGVWQWSGQVVISLPERALASSIQALVGVAGLGVVMGLMARSRAGIAVLVVGRWAATLAVAGGAADSLDLIQTGMDVRWLAGSLTLLLPSIWMAAWAGRLRWALKRQARRPTDYEEVSRPVDDDAEAELRRVLRKLEEAAEARKRPRAKGRPRASAGRRNGSGRP